MDSLHESLEFDLAVQMKTPFILFWFHCKNNITDVRRAQSDLIKMLSVWITVKLVRCLFYSAAF